MCTEPSHQHTTPHTTTQHYALHTNTCHHTHLHPHTYHTTHIHPRSTHHTPHTTHHTSHTTRHTPTHQQLNGELAASQSARTEMEELLALGASEKEAALHAQLRATNRRLARAEAMLSAKDRMEEVGKGGQIVCDVCRVFQYLISSIPAHRVDPPPHPPLVFAGVAGGNVVTELPRGRCELRFTPADSGPAAGACEGDRGKAPR